MMKMMKKAVFVLLSLALLLSLATCKNPDDNTGQDAWRVTFDKNGGDDDAVPAFLNIPKDNAKLPTTKNMPIAPTKEGYTFIEWNDKDDGKGTIYKASSSIKGNITLYAIWGGTVTFNANGGSPTPKDVIVKEGATIGTSMPTYPTKGNETATSWNTKADGTGTTFTGTTVVDGNLTVYAKWPGGSSSVEVTITFRINDSPTSTSHHFKRYTTVGGNLIGDWDNSTPNRLGYNFVEWNTLANGNGTKFEASTVVTLAMVTMVTGNDATMDVYAKWSLIPVNTFTVTFNSNGGQPNYDPRTVNQGAQLGELPVVTLANNSFRGWWDDNGTQYFANTTITKDVTLSARWEAAGVNDVLVTFIRNHNDYDNEPLGTVYVAMGTNLKTQDLPSDNPEKKGYVFGNWNQNRNGSGLSGTSIVVNQTMNVYAFYDSYDYTVTFNTDSTPPTVVVHVVSPNTTVGLLWPSNPTREGYEFNYWKTAEGGQFDADTPVKGNMGVTAQWDPRQNPNPTYYTIEFNSNGGSSVSSMTELENASITLPSPTKGTDTFKGWFSSTTSTTQYTSPHTVTGNLTMYAQWESSPNPSPTTYTITFNSNGGSTVNPMTNLAANATVTLPSPTKENNTFEGWFSSTTSTTQYTSPYTVTGNIDMYAQWTPFVPPSGDAIYVTFMSNGSHVAGRIISGGSIGAANMPPDPVSGDNIFGGWYTENNGGGTAFNGTTQVTANRTVYAKWTEDTEWTTVYYSMKDLIGEPIEGHFHAGGGEREPNNTNNRVTIKEIFVNTTVSTTGAQYIYNGTWVGGTRTIGGAGMTDNNVISINRQSSDHQYQGGFSSALLGGANYEQKYLGIKYKDYSGNVRLILTRANGDDGGWVLPGGNWPNGKPIYVGGGTPGSGDMENILSGGGSSGATVTFMYNYGGTYIYETRTVASGSSVGAANMPDDPKREGYYFTKWATGETGGPDFLASTTVSGNATVYAQWGQAQTYTVTFDAGYPGGGTIATRTASSSQTGPAYVSDLPPLPTRTGDYACTGWVTSYEGTTAFTTTTAVTANTTVYAKWAATSGTFTVTFNGNGGTPTPQAVSVAYPYTLASLPAGPTHSDSSYSFVGWFDSATGGTKYSVGMTIQGNVTLYAQYSQYVDPDAGWLTKYVDLAALDLTIGTLGDWAPGNIHFHAGGDGHARDTDGNDASGGSVTIRKIFVNSTPEKNENAAYLFDGTTPANASRKMPGLNDPSGVFEAGNTTQLTRATGVPLYSQSLSPAPSTVSGKVVGTVPNAEIRLNSDNNATGKVYKYQGGMASVMMAGQQYLGIVYKEAVGNIRFQVSTNVISTANGGNTDTATDGMELKLVYFNEGNKDEGNYTTPWGNLAGKQRTYTYLKDASEFGATAIQPPPVVSTPSINGGPVILAHYMPWYEGPKKKGDEADTSLLRSNTSHWMLGDSFNPSTTVTNGQINVFATRYPLTGPYSQTNDKLLEYQLSLMKIAGIDGVLFDWYGHVDAADYKSIHDRTLAMVEVLKRTNMKFAVCYEDRTVINISPGGLAGQRTAAAAAFKFMEDTWFSLPQYVKIDGRPVVLNFGPLPKNADGAGFTAADYDIILQNINPKPIFVVMPHLVHLAPNSHTAQSTAFNWPGPLTANSTQPTPIEDVKEDLDAYLINYSSKRYKIFTVFSGFRDMYMGKHATQYKYGRINYANGAVWDYTWEEVMKRNPHIVQIATWNDYGEDAMIEPTMHLEGATGEAQSDRGYAELLKIQNWVKSKNPSHPYDGKDLRRPLEIYRAHYGSASGANATATAATEALFANNRASFISNSDMLGNPVTASDATTDLRPMKWGN